MRHHQTTSHLMARIGWRSHTTSERKHVTSHNYNPLDAVLYRRCCLHVVITQTANTAVSTGRNTGAASKGITLTGDLEHGLYLAGESGRL